MPTTKKPAPALSLEKRREMWFDLLDDVERLKDRIESARELLGGRRNLLAEYLSGVTEELLLARPRK